MFEVRVLIVSCFKHMYISFDVLLVKILMFFFQMDEAGGDERTDKRTQRAETDGRRERTCGRSGWRRMSGRAEHAGGRTDGEGGDGRTDIVWTSLLHYLAIIWVSFGDH